MKIKAIIEYDGSKFNGFQIQKHTSNTIVESLQNTLLSLGINSKIIGSGRTDKGVHASYQVISFKIPFYWQKKSLNELKIRLNQKLEYIRIKYLKIVDNSFHPQYDAKKRVYKYIIKTKEKRVFEEDFVSFYKINNLEKFKLAIKIFEGKHSFKYFKKKGSITNSDIREIYKIKVINKNNYIIVYFIANGYLRSQIRLMIASALEVEKGNISIKELKEQLNLKKRYITKLSCPKGLYLARVFY